MPGWDEQSKDTAALDLIRALYFGPTSELFNKLVIEEQRLDSLEAPASEDVDPSLMTIIATVKKPEDAIYVRDWILAAARERARVGDVTATAERHQVLHQIFALAVARQHRADCGDDLPLRGLRAVVFDAEPLLVRHWTR